MSAASCLLTEQQLLCGICLDVFTDPVTLPCGHNFCKNCIKQHWDSSTKCQCPSCKEPFYKRLDLRVNTFISEMAAQFRQSARQNSLRAAKPGEVACDICGEPKMKALRSCLVCLASYCDAHLKPHLTAPRLKKHQLTDPVENLEGRMCTIHEKPLELFCKTDQTCVCMLCPVLDHKSHEVVPLKEQFERKKSQLGKRGFEIHRMIQERRLRILDIKQSLKLSNEAAEKELSESVQVFTGLMECFERVHTELLGTIEEKQKAAERQGRGFIGELEQEISELERTRAELEQLSRTKDHLHFLQHFESLETSTFTKDWTEIRVNPSYEGSVMTALDQLEKTLCKEMKRLRHAAELRRVQLFAVDLTLDPDTAHPSLVLSDDGKQVHHGVVKKKNLPDSPRRFNPSCCVLTKQSFSSGRFYFEAQVKEKTRWTLGVAKESIKRKGVVPLSPDNGHWTVWLKNIDEYAALVGSPLPLSVNSRPQTVGVFVDCDEGLVSFYDVDAADLLYSFTDCSFTEKLYPFISPGLNDDGINSAPVVISSMNRT